MASDAVTHAVVILVDDVAEAATVADVIADVARAKSVALVPPSRGASFFTDGDGASEVDSWWRERVPARATPVYVMDFSPGVLAWLPGLDGHFLIRGLPAMLAEDAGSRVEGIDAASPLELAGHVLRHLADAGACSVEDANGLLAFARATQPTVPMAAPLATAPPAPNPFDLLAAMAAAEQSPSRPSRPSHTAPSPLSTSGATRRVDRRSVADMLRLSNLRGLRAARSDPLADDNELATSLARRGATVVAVGSRKGGVGKTSHAAGMAIVAGSVLDAIGHRAVIVDANVANPDAWGVLNLPLGAATVRDTVAACPPTSIHHGRCSRRRRRLRVIRKPVSRRNIRDTTSGCLPNICGAASRSRWST